MERPSETCTSQHYKVNSVRRATATKDRTNTCFRCDQIENEHHPPGDWSAQRLDVRHNDHSCVHIEWKPKRATLPRNVKTMNHQRKEKPLSAHVNISFACPRGRQLTDSVDLYHRKRRNLTERHRHTAASTAESKAIAA